MPKKKAHQHAEAFMLMLYSCQECDHSEILWNSRDGVTPFGIQCPKCNGINMLHVAWEDDQYAPDHVPHEGQGVWIDMPQSLKRTLVLARLEVGRAHGYDVPSDPHEREQLIKAVMESFQPGEPWLIRWPVREVKF